MATLEQANIYHKARDNVSWAKLEREDAEKAEALLEDAEQYLRSTYNIRPDLSEAEQRSFDGLTSRLAGIFAVQPPVDAAVATIKKQSSELKGMKKEVEYNQAGPDPYPYITAVVQSLTVQSTSFSVGRMRRR